MILLTIKLLQYVKGEAECSPCFILIMNSI